MNLQSHLLLMGLFASCVAVVGAAMLKDTLREQVRTGAGIFGSLVGGAVVLAWILYIFPL